MNFRKVKAISKRELRERLFSKTFIVMTLLIPAIFIVLIGIETYLLSYEEDTAKQIIIVSETPELTGEMEKRFSNGNSVTESKFLFEFKTLRKERFEKELQKWKPLILDETITGVVFIPGSALETKTFSYYSKTPNNKIITLKLKKIINDALIAVYFERLGLSGKDMEFAKSSISIKEMKVSTDEITEKSKGSEAIAFLFLNLLYFSLIVSGQLILRSVIEEKQNRIVEILLSSISGNELMAGKITGAAITSLAQMFIWLSPVVLAVSTSWFALPKELAVTIPWWQWFYFMLNFLIGLLTFLALFAAVGAMFDNEQDSQNGMWPLMVLLMIPFFIAISLMQNPSTSISQIASLVPFASLFVMPVRMSFVDVPLYEFLLSIVVNLITLLVLIPITGKIYRTGILMIGKRPTWGEVFKWLKS